jgi:hypothetical protein
MSRLEIERSRLICLKGHVELPRLLVLDRPVTADGLAKRRARRFADAAAASLVPVMSMFASLIAR